MTNLLYLVLLSNILGIHNLYMNGCLKNERMLHNINFKRLQKNKSLFIVAGERATSVTVFFHLKKIKI